MIDTVIIRMSYKTKAGKEIFLERAIPWGDWQETVEHVGRESWLRNITRGIADVFELGRQEDGL